jgi:hypothetical protein
MSFIKGKSATRGDRPRRQPTSLSFASCAARLHHRARSLRPASNSSTRTAEARGCGYESGIKRRVRQQLTESAGGHRVHRRERRRPRRAATEAAPRRRVRFPLAFLAANNRNQPAPTTGADADSKTSSRDGVFGILVILRGNSVGKQALRD